MRPLLSISSLLLVAWFTLLMPGCSAAEPARIEAPLEVVLPNNWAPLSYLGEKGQPEGLLVDYWRLLADKNQRQVYFELLDSHHTLRRLSNSSRLIHGGLLKSRQFGEFNYSRPLLTLRTALFVSNELPRIISIDELGNEPVGVTAQSYEEEHLHRYNPRLTLKLFNNAGQMIEAAARGEIAAFIAQYPVGMYYLGKYSTPERFRVVSVLYTRALQAAVKSGEVEQFNALNQMLTQMSNDDLARLTQKWIGREQVKVLPLGWMLLFGGGIALLLIGALVVYNKRLIWQLADQDAEIEKQKRQLLLLTANMSDWVWKLDRHQRFTYVSPSVKKLLGYEVEELLNQPMASVLHSSDQERALAQFSHMLNVARRGEIRNFRDITARYGLLHKDGDLVWTEAALRIFFTPGGEFAGAQGCSRDVSERMRAEAAFRQLAFNDPLTQLPNRRLLNDRLQQTIASSARSKHYAALLFMDMDNFKYINDNYGHDQGDLLLQQIAQRLAGAVRESDTLARFGGDEFALIVEQLSQDFETARHQVLMIGVKLAECFDREFMLQEVRCSITTSLGIALFNSDAKSVKALFKYADIAMYQAKASGRNRCVISDYNQQGD